MADLWTVNINYDGSKLTVTLTDPAEGSSFTAINGYAINLASMLGQNTAYVGFTSGTGTGWENHDIVNWTFANTAQSGGTGSSYDPVANFATSPPANPSGVWSYGYETQLGSGFTLFAYKDTTGTPGVVAWEFAQGPFPASSIVPMVAKNTTSSTITVSTVQFPPNVLDMHPGANGQYAVVRFTAPSGSTYSFSGSFTGLDTLGTTTDVHILKNGSASLFSGAVPGASAPTFNITQNLFAGDTIDFAVGYGANGNYFNDSTGLQASVTLGSSTTCTYRSFGHQRFRWRRRRRQRERIVTAGCGLLVDGGEQQLLDHHHLGHQLHGQRHRELQRGRQHRRGPLRHPHHRGPDLHRQPGRGIRRPPGGLQLLRQPVEPVPAGPPPPAGGISRG